METSIIICTRNRAKSLEATLASFSDLRLPQEGKVELVVVDNGSTDDTRKVVEDALLNSPLRPRYVREPAPGLSRARNTGLQESSGKYILFTDDDVRPGQEWLVNLLEALKSGADAASGPILLGPELERPWLRSQHRPYLAATGPGSAQANHLIGANMAFRRSVLVRVPGFDPALGAGALGACEETLFSRQLKEAGLAVRFVKGATVVHHPGHERLLRRNLLTAAERMGRSNAYVAYHWEHRSPSQSVVRRHYFRLKLGLRRMLTSMPRLNDEGAPSWELSYIWRYAFHDQLAKESTQARRYPLRGLSPLRQR